MQSLYELTLELRNTLYKEVTGEDVEINKYTPERIHMIRKGLKTVSNGYCYDNYFNFMDDCFDYNSIRNYTIDYLPYCNGIVNL